MGDEWTVPLFADPISDAASALLSLLAVTFASAGSIGGGGLLVPLYVLVSHLGRSAIPLSKATIMGGAIANAFMRWPARHPSADRPLIAFDVAVMLEPTTLIGTVVGVTLNEIFPQWLITVCLVGLLGFTARKTLVKALATWAKENEASLEAASKLAPPLMRRLSGSFGRGGSPVTAVEARSAVAFVESESFQFLHEADLSTPGHSPPYSSSPPSSLAAPLLPSSDSCVSISAAGSNSTSAPRPARTSPSPPPLAPPPARGCSATYRKTPLG